MKKYQDENSIIPECTYAALIKLLEEKSFSAISVSELCKTANISRMTFYRYFDTKEDVIDKYLDMRFREYHAEVTKGKRHASFIQRDNILLGFEFFRKESDAIACLIKNNLGSSLRNQIIANELDLSLNSRENMESKYLTIAYASALYGIMVNWVVDGMNEDPEILTDLILSVYQNKIRRF